MLNTSELKRHLDLCLGPQIAEEISVHNGCSKGCRGHSTSSLFPSRGVSSGLLVVVG